MIERRSASAHAGGLCETVAVDVADEHDWRMGIVEDLLAHPGLYLGVWIAC
jgi:hypothetical protein